MKIIIYILIILFTVQSTAQGQSSAPYQACFTFETTPPYSVSGCDTMLVKVKNCSGGTGVAGHRLPQYDWGDGRPNAFPEDSIHKYYTTGTFTITQNISTLGNPIQDIKTATVVVNPKPVPNFKILICQSLIIKVQTLDNAYDKYVINWNEGAGVPNDTINGNSIISHTSTPGVKNIAVKGIYVPGTCSSNIVTTSVTPIQNLIKPDLINLIVNGNGQITLTLNAIKGQRYYLDQRNGATGYALIQTLPAITGISSITVPNLDTDNLQYCFRFRSFDDCGNELASEEICSNIVTATPQNNQNLVSWSSFMGSSFGSYTLYKGTSVLSSPATNPYIDNNVICGNNDCYFLVTKLTTLTVISSSPIQSISYRSCATATSTDVPPPIQNLYSTVAGNSINLTWDVPVFVPAATQYNILRSDGASFTSNTNSFTDNTVNLSSKQYCYQVIYTPCTTPSTVSNSTCPVFLSGDEIGGVNLSWTSYSCASGASDYTLERLDPNTNAIASSVNPVSSPYQDPLADPNAPVLKYRIKTSCLTSLPSYSNIFEINHELKIFLPNAFTPNGDGNNDYFTVKGNYIKDIKMTIFNRWGEIVFYTEELGPGWDGKYKGDIASMDAYAYMVEATDNFGNKLSRKGTVTLLR